MAGMSSVLSPPLLLLLLLLLPLPPPPPLLLLGTPLTLSTSSNLSSELSAANLSPGSGCGPHEYEYRSARRCCQRCPAGQYVEEPCSSPHTRSECEACDTGTYTGHANGLRSCLLCTTCREDQEMVSDCTPKQNRQCQCKTGEFYCDSEDCLESCYRCTRCPEGKVVLQTCNATADTLCGPPGPGPGRRHRFWWMAGWLFAAVVGALVILCVRKPRDGGGRAACCCPHAGPVSTGRPYRRDSLVSAPGQASPGLGGGHPLQLQRAPRCPSVSRTRAEGLSWMRLRLWRETEAPRPAEPAVRAEPRPESARPH
ncbi:tumor necrosis factor receptor superfamily member 22-like [Myotis yumanensis]|uniref:tumor necrosis factor receptor superfamily member 22-like n=1 Tax=Myotis yumanensis TaxID=159337 RepID=UPI0038D4508F